MKGFSYLLTTLGMLASISAANGASYIWDNQEGLKEVSNCQAVDLDSNPFKISKYTGPKNLDYEILRNSSKVQQSNLPVGSLIRHETGGSRVSRYDYIYVIGVNYSAIPRVNRYTAKRNDRNYIYEKSIVSIDDYAIKLTKDVRPPGEESMKGYVFVPVNSPGYQKLECEGQNSMKGRGYVLFNGFKSGKDPIVVGVSIEETGLFRDIETVKKSTLSNIDSSLAANLFSGSAQAEPEQTLEEEVAQEEEVTIAEETALEEEVATEEGLHEGESEEATGEDAVAEAAAETATTEVGIENVICHPFTALNVRDESLNEVLFGARRHESVKVFQSWDGETQEKKVGDSTVTYIKVQFSEREENDQQVGWVSAKYVVEAGNCPKLEKDVRENPATKISGLEDKKCCDFPTVKAPTHPYTGSGANQRRFRAGRKGGRLHAACDLYRYKGEGVRSVAPGKVIDRDYFYQGTSQITVKHDGGFVVRYGEIISGKMANMWVGKKSTMGEVIGYIGVVNSGCCRPMLHYEMYTGKLNGPLTVIYRNMNGKFGRRDDLMNPTTYLQKWQKDVF